MLTLGDLKKIDLPDDTPIVHYDYDGAWDYLQFKEWNSFKVKDTGDGYFLMVNGKDKFPLKQIIELEQ